MSEKIRVAGYVKLAKLWEKHREEALAYHNKYYEDKFAGSEKYELAGVYIDITGNKQIAKRPEMVRLLNDCRSGKVQCIAAQTKAYLAANMGDFCYMVKLLSGINGGIDLLTEDDDYRIDTVTDFDGQKQALIQMADEFIGLNPEAYNAWKKSVTKACGGKE
ncbi:MAG: recombinase family protein [Clostridiales bacterium]|nr:recombinase family protein [Clostridiales bacterium]